jgi:hypothetical protein
VALTMIFAIPFLALLSRKLKTIPPLMALVATSSAVGLFVEKIILITPVVPVSPVVVAIEFVAMIALVVLVFRGRDSFLPQLVTGSSGTAAGRAGSAELAATRQT